jgi:hypothetical protein
LRHNFKNKTNMALITIDSESKVPVTLTPTTASGNTASLDGIPSWAVLSGDATLEVAEDGLSCFLVSGTVGNSVIEVSADADLGEGIRSLTDTIDLAVVSAEASVLGLNVGTAVPK